MITKKRSQGSMTYNVVVRRNRI